MESGSCKAEVHSDAESFVRSFSGSTYLEICEPYQEEQVTCSCHKLCETVENQRQSAINEYNRQCS